MANYTRPKEGFRYGQGGVKTNSVPDAIPIGQYSALQNIRSVTATSFCTRPGMVSMFTAGSSAITDLRAYSTLGADDRPRFLARNAQDQLYLDNGAIVGTMASGSHHAPGAFMIPFRPNQSPNPYMYVATNYDYQKFSAPFIGSNVITQQNVGIAEPQLAPSAGITTYNQAYVGEPAGGAYNLGGTSSNLQIGNRVSDTVQGIYPDPVGLGMVSVQVAGGATLPAGVYLSGSVVAYFWEGLSYEQGAFGRYYPLSVGSAAFTNSGSSILFNPPQYNGSPGDPNIHPAKWANCDVNGNITGYHDAWPADNNSGFRYDMVVLATLFIPVAGTYIMTFNHDDGMFFAIQGASYVSGSSNDPYFNHTQTVVNGYAFSGAVKIAGSNVSGYHNIPYYINFPVSGSYPIEINYSQWKNNQCLEVYNGVNHMKQATGIGAYQRGMAISLGGNLFTVEDVYPPLPQSLPISSITYLNGNTGECVIVPSALGSGPGIDGASIYEINLLASLRRGSLVQIGSEVCFVWDVETGPNGTVCFTTSTIATHTTSDILKGVPAIALLGGSVAVGTPITSPDVQFSVAPGIGTVTTPQNLNPFSLVQAQPDDYIHLSLNIDNLAALTEAKLLFDVSDGSFTQNFYYYTIRPNDIALGVQNGLTQLGVAQLVAQRAAIDEEKTAESANQGPTSSSAQTATGSLQWSEILFSITGLTRVGNDQSKTLQNLTSVQLLINASTALNVVFNSISVKGGFAADVGPSGAPYLYRVRPRSSVTGAKGNPSPPIRYGTNPRRAAVTVVTPSAASYDSQIDTWDIFRYGGTVTSWRYIGQVPSSVRYFLDNYSDESALAGEELEFDNYQPWPSIDLPLNATATTVTGTLAVVTIPAVGNVLQYLPGNQVKIGGTNVYTLFNRPVFISGTSYLFRFVENAGAGINLPLSIYEPAIAQQRLPYIWGPDANGTVFAVGDSLRSGNVYECKSNAPDSAPDTYNQEVTPPSEPLMGGEVMDGVSYVASTERWWRMYFQPNGIDRYTLVQQNLPRGLAAPYGRCTDGSSISWVAKDGIWDTAEGSLTDADLYNLFPHEGVPGQAVTYGPVTYQPPDYSRAASMRLETGNGYIYFTYQDASLNYHTMVYDRKRKAWSLDAYGVPVSTVYHVEQQTGSLIIPGTLYQSIVYGTYNGSVAVQTDAANDLGLPIPCVVATPEWDGGDVRAGEQWGDLWLDSIPVSAITATPMFLGAPAAPPSVIGPNISRVQTPVSLGGGVVTDYLGLLTTWQDNFSSQSSATRLHIWQPSFIPKPEMINDRFTDWYSLGDGDEVAPAAWWQGFILHADTSNVVKGLQVRDADSQTIHPFTPVVQHNGEQSKAYSFNTPFIAHLVRIEPTDQTPWRMFEVEWIGEPTPEQAETWQTQGMSFGFNGYSHIQRIVAAYASTTPITLTITSFDGQSPQPITLPSTGGLFQKTLFVLTANKGMLYFFKASSAAPFQLYLPDFEIQLGHWGRTDGYLNYRSLGGAKGDKAEI